MIIKITRIDWPFIRPFRIAYRFQTHSEAVIVEVNDGGFVGRGEGLGVSYRGETAASIHDQLADAVGQIMAGDSIEVVRLRLGPGGAASALDCAFWDLAAKKQARRAWDLANLPLVRPLETTMTLGLGTLRETQDAALAASAFRLLKIKLNGEDDIERVRAVRRARPDAAIFVDANQSWNEAALYKTIPALADLGVLLIEQPLPAENDEALRRFRSPIPICADESCQTVESLPQLRDKYDFINIKLDKTGGLTEALALANAASTAGFRLMVGCMGGSSLSIAPAILVGQLCEYVDLDGPLLQAEDISPGLRYDRGFVYPAEPEVWG